MQNYGRVPKRAILHFSGKVDDIAAAAMSEAVEDVLLSVHVESGLIGPVAGVQGQRTVTDQLVITGRL